MSNLNITFKGKKYSIDKSLLEGAISSLETVLEGLGGSADGLEPITWDGNAEGRDYIDMGYGMYAYKISDNFCTYEQLLTSEVRMKQSDGTITEWEKLVPDEQAMSMCMPFDGGNGGMGAAGAIITIMSLPVILSGTEMAAPSTGIYVMVAPNGQYVAEVRFPS